MIPLNITICAPSSHSLSSPFLSACPHRTPHKLKLTGSYERKSLNQKKLKQLRGKGICRAELSNDAPFAIAIGGCMLNSLLFPYTGASLEEEEEEEDAMVGPTDARFAVMSIISLIPYFNWLSWVFALMDTGKRRYAVYAIVYLAPYLRTNLSLSPEESWLPIASIVLCIIHIQLEASIINGDLDGFNFFNEVAKRLGLVTGREDGPSRTRGKKHEEGRRLNDRNLPWGQKKSRDEIEKLRIPRKPSRDLEHVTEDGDLDDGKKH